MAKSNKKQNFGGTWTTDKLEVLKKYLSAYTTILKKYPFYKIAYIDAFAGSGKIKNKSLYDFQKNLFGEEIYENIEIQEYFTGSAIMSLEAQPQFDKYIFIELDENKCNILKETIQAEFSDMQDKIEYYNRDSNKVLTELCQKDWSKHRAIVFLDPFAMEAEWITIEKIAETKAIDLWILFPLGVSVNRLLMKNRDKMPKNWSDALDKLFGTHEWYDEFYTVKQSTNLFGEEESIGKTADFNIIANFYIKRLKTKFSEVLEQPLYLYNSTNNPLFMLCFASNNKTAIRIAKDITSRKK